MRIPFPERFPINRVAIFVVVLFAIQILEGTALYFSVGCGVFVLIAAFAFNAAGGLTRASGAYVFFYATLVVIVGICYKAFLGEPAQSNLIDPKTDIEAYVGSIVAMYAAVIVSRRLARKTGLIQNLLKESEMYRACVGCIAFGIGGASLIELLGESATGVISAFNQLNQLVPLGIIIGVTYEIRRSGGTRSVNLATAVGAAFIFVMDGLIGFSKAALLLPIVCWIAPVGALRYRLTARQMFGSLLGVFVIFHWLVPLSQYGKGHVPEFPTVSQRLAVAIPLLEHPEETRQTYYKELEAIDGPRGLSAYYSTPQGLWERLQMLSADDALIEVTDEGKIFGLLPIKLGFINAIPHFIWPNKPGINAGNAYAHDIAGEAQGEGDTSTGISFSPTGEAYHLARWPGVFVLAPLLWCLMFMEVDSIFGDLRATPWGLLALAYITHVSSEGGLSGLIYLITFGVEILVFCACFATWIAPIFAIPFLGPDRLKPDRDFSFRPTVNPRVRAKL